MIKCKICSNQLKIIFSKRILTKYEIFYYQCNNCYFIQTEEPYWLNEAYDNGAIAAVDVGIMTRNILYVEKTINLLKELKLNLNNFQGLDYGGGYGIFVRMMRDKGVNFYLKDKYAENLFARYFELENLSENLRFDVVTAFEVLEHLKDPIPEIKKLFEFSDILIFSTELQPSRNIAELSSWWYLVPDGGQHISLYSRESLNELKNYFDAFLYTNESNLHILSKNKLETNPFVKSSKSSSNMNKLTEHIKSIITKKFKLNNHLKSGLNERKSLIQEDFEYVKNKINNLED